MAQVPGRDARPRRPILMLLIASMVLAALAAGCGVDPDPPTPTPTPSGGPTPGPSTPTPSAAPSVSPLVEASRLTVRLEVPLCESTAVRVGSGFLIGPKTVVTAAHVVDQAAAVSVRASTDGYWDLVTSGEVVAVDPDHDLAIVQLQKYALTTAAHQLAFAKEPAKRDDSIAAIGYPLGLRRTTTRGTVNNTGVSATVQIGDADNDQTKHETRKFTGLVQFDAGTSPGDSGGPLVDASGQVVGVVTSQRSGQGNLNLNWAEPADRAADLVDDWKDGDADPGSDCPYDNPEQDLSSHPDGLAIFRAFTTYTLGVDASHLDYAVGQVLTDAYDVTDDPLKASFGGQQGFEQSEALTFYADPTLVSVDGKSYSTDVATVRYRRYQVDEEQAIDCHDSQAQLTMSNDTGFWRITRWRETRTSGCGDAALADLQP